MIRRCLCITLVEWRTKHGVYSDAETANALCNEPGLFADGAEAATFLNALIDAGYRYQGIENNLGVSVSMLIGNELPESRQVFTLTNDSLTSNIGCSWTKLIPKSGPKFDEVMLHLRKIGLHTKFPPSYYTLRERVVRWLLDQFEQNVRSAHHSGAPFRSVSSSNYGLAHSYELDWEHDWVPN